MSVLASFLIGFLFAVGLALSGMTHPSKVIGFLDFFGEWDSSLVFVMGSAVTTFFFLRRKTRSMMRPLFADSFHLPTRNDLDPPLIVGAILFGIGWGLIGLCPGPVLASLMTLNPQILLFAGAMVAGMLAHTLWQRTSQ